MRDTHLGAVAMETRYEAVCRDAAGNIKWVATAKNLVVTRPEHPHHGLLQNHPQLGDLVSRAEEHGTPDAADVMNSHATWTELTAYDEATRPAWTPGTVSAGSVSNTASKARFTASGAMTVLGLFMTSNNTKSGTTGTLYGAATSPKARARWWTTTRWM